MTEAAGASDIVVDGLHKSFDTLDVLKGINLSVARGDIVAIVGGSGSGKTVLLECIIGSLIPDAGRVLVADYDLPNAPLVDLAQLDDEQMDRLRMHWSVVFQRNALFSGTVYDNIALWLREIKRMPEQEIAIRVRKSLHAVGLEPADVQMKTRDELSGGMAKRVAIARAIAMEPSIIFYDEPTTGLDPNMASQLHELVYDMHHDRSRTSIIITHDKDLLRRIEPRVCMLHKGRVFFDGSYREFQNRCETPIIRPYFEKMPVLHGRTEPTQMR